MREITLDVNGAKHTVRIDEKRTPAADPDGAISGFEIRSFMNAGPYCGGSINVQAAMCGKMFKVYDVPNMRFHGRAVCTNTPVGGAVPGAGPAGGPNAPPGPNGTTSVILTAMALPRRPCTATGAAPFAPAITVAVMGEDGSLLLRTGLTDHGAGTYTLEKQIVAAVNDALGAELVALPLTPQRVLAAVK